VLGEGGFGKVFAVSKNDTRALYACKTMSKQKIIGMLLLLSPLVLLVLSKKA
jgi:serine/threonine protein kinase